MILQVCVYRVYVLFATMHYCKSILVTKLKQLKMQQHGNNGIVIIYRIFSSAPRYRIDHLFIAWHDTVSSIGIHSLTER